MSRSLLAYPYVLGLFLALSFGSSATFASAIAVDDSGPCASERTRIAGWQANKHLHQSIKNPADDGFEFNQICDFNAWSWQTFMWLTQEVKTHAGDMQPRFLSDEFVSPYQFLGIANREVLKPVTGPQEHIFDETVQAGPDGILVDQNGNVVYYSQYLNHTFTDFMEKNHLKDPQAVQEIDPKTTFPPGTLELKVSWQIVEPNDNTSKAFTTQAKVYGLKIQSGKIVIDVENIRSVKLKAVGFHIAGVVPGHPEMIWATFEQLRNAPIVPDDFSPNTVVSNEHFTFFDPKPASSSPKLTNTYASCNKNFVASPYMKLDMSTQKISPVTQVCLQYEFGNSAENDPLLQPTVTTNNQSIALLNKVVGEKLRADNPHDPWGYYREIGAIWFKGADRLKPGMDLATDFAEDGSQLLVGSLKLSNSTIETYTQFANTEHNCFRCHNTEQRLLNDRDGKALMSLKPTNLNISHAFVNIYTWTQIMARTKAP